jgi:DNA-binding NtrC family response regulator
VGQRARLAVVRTQVELGRALRRSQRLEAENRLLRDQGTNKPSLIAESAAMRPVLELIARVGPSDANVLVTGENGSGKGTIAQALHAVSSRATRPLVTVNAGGLSEGLFESELFGHVKGAFTDAKSDRVGRFELAEGGTLFLDEIANISLNLQAKLLRVLETGEFERVGSSRTRRANVRIISATNADLTAEVTSNRFRQDLLFRLNTIEIPLPPLRDRREDIPVLARHFLAQHAQRYRKNITGFEAAAMQTLLDHAWPGNVRELDHSVERAVLMAQDDVIKGRDLGLRAPKDAVAPDRGHEPRRGRRVPDQEGARPLRRQRQPGRQGAGAEPKRVVPTTAAIRAVADGRTKVRPYVRQASPAYVTLSRDSHVRTRRAEL